MIARYDCGDLRPSKGPPSLFPPGLVMDTTFARMRNAKILVAGLRGIATEVIKNIVLAGVGTLVIVDGEKVCGEDLGAGFFFRDEDVGSMVSVQLHAVLSVCETSLQRTVAAKTRVENLNPLVIVQTISSSLDSMDEERLDVVLRGVDLVCVTDSSRNILVSIHPSHMSLREIVSFA
jgi:ubiquitin-like 1-activating enzyme E1 A